jgi:hypothetical protein
MSTKKTKKTKKTTPVRGALVPTSALQPLVCDGLGALKKAHKSLIDDVLKPQFADSLDIDTPFSKSHATQNRWDYLLGHSPTKTLIAVEPHTANEDEVDVIIRKKKAARDQLRGHLTDSARISAWVWVTEGKVKLAKTSKGYLRLISEGISFAGEKIRSTHLG